MIRVLHVVTYMGRGGLETMLMNYYRNIDRNNIQFDFLVHRDFEADYDKEILELGGHIYHLPRLNPFSPSYHKQLNQFLKEHDYKIIHVHQDCLSSIALKAAYKNQIPVRIAHSHNANQDKNIKYLIKRYFMKSIPQYATHLFACGKEAGDWMFKGKDFTIMNNAIDSQRFVYDESQRNIIRNKLNITINDKILGHVGRFSFQKNHDFIIDVFHQLYLLDNSYKLLLIGTGDLQEQIKEKVKQLNLENNVIFLGNRSDVNELMQAMDVFIFPSHYEGLPVTLVEAQASGLPILKSSHVPDQCIMTPYVYTLSLDDDVNIWTHKIIDIYNHHQRSDISKYIKEAGYDIKENAKWLEEFYLKGVSQYE